MANRPFVNSDGVAIAVTDHRHLYTLLRDRLTTNPNIDLDVLASMCVTHYADALNAQIDTERVCDRAGKGKSKDKGRPTLESIAIDMAEGALLDSRQRQREAASSS